MKLIDFTFRDTGITVKIRKISPMLVTDISESIPMPKPPLNEVDYGEPRGKVQEPNLQDPAYQKALEDRQVQIFKTWRRVMILRGVQVEGEAWKEEVKEYRAFMQEQTGYPLEETNDLVVYVLRLCVGSEEDLGELIEAITRRSQPTREEIEKAKDSFRG